MFLKRNKNVISVVEALTQIAAGFKPLGLETISIDQALGRALGKDVASRITHPPVAVSSMDGYAIRAEDAKGVPFELFLSWNDIIVPATKASVSLLFINFL